MCSNTIIILQPIYKFYDYSCMYLYITDRNSMKASFFFSVTLCLVFGSFVWAYLPDNMMRDWSQREAFLELRRRESLGLEPVSRDYVDPATVELPSDEELGDTEIII